MEKDFGCPITHLAEGNNIDHIRNALVEALENNGGYLAIVCGNCPKRKEVFGHAFINDVHLKDCCVATRNLAVWIAFGKLRGLDLNRFIENGDMSPLRQPSTSLPCLFFDRTPFCCIGRSGKEHCGVKINNKNAEIVADSLLLAQLHILHYAGFRNSKLLAVGKEAGKSMVGNDDLGYGNYNFSDASSLNKCFDHLDLRKTDLLVSFAFLPHCTIWRDRSKNFNSFWSTFLKTIVPILAVVCKDLGGTEELTSHLEQHKAIAWSKCRYGFNRKPQVWAQIRGGQNTVHIRMLKEVGEDYTPEDVSSVMADLGSLGFEARVAASSKEAVLKEMSEQGLKAAKNLEEVAKQAIDAYELLLTPEVEDMVFVYLRNYVKSMKNTSNWQPEKLKAALEKLFVVAPGLEVWMAKQRRGEYMYWDPIQEHSERGPLKKHVKMYRGLLAAATILGASSHDANAHAVTNWDNVLDKVWQYILEKEPALVDKLNLDARSPYQTVKKVLDFFKDREAGGKKRARDDRSVTDFGVVNGSSVKEQFTRMFKQVVQYDINEEGVVGPGKKNIHPNSVLFDLTKDDRASLKKLYQRNKGATAEEEYKDLIRKLAIAANAVEAGTGSVEDHDNLAVKVQAAEDAYVAVLVDGGFPKQDATDIAELECDLAQFREGGINSDEEIVAQTKTSLESLTTRH